MRTVSLILVAVLVFSGTGFANQSEATPQVAKVRAQVQKRGTGEKSRVRVTLASGTMLKGYIAKIEQSSFDVNDTKTGKTTAVSYTDVQKIQGPGLSKRAKAVIVVVVAVGVVAAVLGIGCASTKFCR